MTPGEVTRLAAGDRVYWWFDTGLPGGGQVAATVVRVNRATVTVRNGFGELVRVRHAALAGRVDWDESS